MIVWNIVKVESGFRMAPPKYSSFLNKYRVKSNEGLYSGSNYEAFFSKGIGRVNVEVFERINGSKMTVVQ